MGWLNGFSDAAQHGLEVWGVLLCYRVDSKLQLVHQQRQQDSSRILGGFFLFVVPRLCFDTLACRTKTPA